jgi:hypothetical protein
VQIFALGILFVVDLSASFYPTAFCSHFALRLRELELKYIIHGQAWVMLDGCSMGGLKFNCMLCFCGLG